MQHLNKSLLAASLLFLLLAVSYLLCIIDNLWQSVLAAQSGDTMIVSSGTVMAGFFWLVSHGVHGAAVIALPALLVRRFTPKPPSFT